MARGGAPPADVRERMDDLDALEIEARARLAALPEDRGGRLAASGVRTLARLRRERAELRPSLGLLPARPATAVPERDPDLEALREALSDLTYAHADAVATLADPTAVGVLVRHMGEVARLLAVVELWIDEELRRE